MLLQKYVIFVSHLTDLLTIVSTKYKKYISIPTYNKKIKLKKTFKSKLNS